MCLRFFAIVCSIFALTASAQQLLQVQVVTRHGARTPLTKAAASLVEGGSVLTPVGLKQMYDLGAFMKERYSAADFLLPIKTYNSSMATFQSSHLDRTLVSANGFAEGFYPQSTRDNSNNLLPSSVPIPNIPVYSSDDVNDVTIRAYNKCPTFSSKLTQLYKSDTWLAEQNAHATLLEKLAKSGFEEYADPGTGKVLLQEVWNCYDAINVAKTECDPDPNAKACTDLENPGFADVLTPQEWTELQNLAHSAELQKYSAANTGDLLGGNLLRNITARASLPADQRQEFYMYSAHYPTLLGMFNTMGLPALPANKETIPNYGSALIFELWKDSSDGLSVKTSYLEGMQDLSNSTNVVITPLSIPGKCNNETQCSLATFQEMVSGLSYADTAGWCDSCANISANECLVAMQGDTEEISLNIYECADCGGTGALMFFVGMFATIFFTLFFDMGKRRGWFRRMGRQQGEQIETVGDNAGLHRLDENGLDHRQL